MRLMNANRSATVMPVSDVDTSMRYYVDVLGFIQQFRHGKYAGVKMGNVEIHLNANGPRLPGNGDIYIFCDEIDAYYAAIVARGAVVQGKPGMAEHGMRDFVSLDPDGNRVSFSVDA
jgi:predicted enzyme related to lactoylglutathione lyase